MNEFPSAAPEVPVSERMDLKRRRAIGPLAGLMPLVLSSAADERFLLTAT